MAGIFRRFAEYRRRMELAVSSVAGRKDRPMIDLHTHSAYSDGTCTPAELVSLAAKTGLSAVALTDHNTVRGLGEFLDAPCPPSLRRVAGIEFSTKDRGNEYHILGLFLPRESWESVREYCAYWHEEKEKSNILLADRLCRAGYRVDYGRIRAESPGEVNRTHFAAELVREGYAADVPEAFRRFLGDGEGFYTEPPKASSCDVLRLIGDWGAVSVLAHPTAFVSREVLEEFVPRAVSCGLCAMETRYSAFDGETCAYLSRLAAEYGLAESGGSDFHGSRRPGVSLGTGRGGLEVPDSFFEELEKRRR